MLGYFPFLGHLRGSDSQAPGWPRPTWITAKNNATDPGRKERVAHWGVDGKQRSRERGHGEVQSDIRPNFFLWRHGP